MKIICDQSLYRELIPGNASLYHQPEWMDLFSQDWKAKIGLHAQNEPVWIWPYYEKSRYGIKKYGRIPNSPDNGPVFLKDISVEVFHPGAIRMLSLTLIDDRRNVLSHDSMVSNGWIVQDRYHQYFDLKSYPHNFQEISRSKRKRLRKNTHLEFTHFRDVSEAGPLFLNLFHNLGQTGLRQKDLDKWKLILDESYDNYVVGLRDQHDNILSAEWLIGHGSTLYGWLAVRHPDFQESGAREMLVWHIIQWAREKYDIYDFGGSSISGVRQFNLKLGAREIEYNRYIRYYPQWIRNLNSLRKVFFG